MVFAQRFLERVVQLFGRELFALFEVQLHQGLVDLDNLVDDLRVGFGDRAERSVVALELEEAVDDLGAVGRRQVHRQAFPAEGFLDVVEYLFEIDAFGIDLVDDDHAAHALVVCGIHHAAGHVLDALGGVDDDSGRLGGRHHGHGSAEEIAVSRGVDQVDVDTFVVEMTD